ncbi:CD59 glycoprotein [Electrophorus electricus]|uniref:UPAR/Ly6 domain-containing protein n=1 Tax=Electrophorus electricus TaxID=8005 RepID=A0A4W4EXM2_ELEEL|nr:CD59 glycoprotein [Electrophorus electricus]
MHRYKGRRFLSAPVFCSTVKESSKMKVLVFALVLGLTVSSGMALDCYHCVPAKAGGACEITTVTCPAGKDACAAAKFLRSPFGHYQKCMAMVACEQLKLNAYIKVKCCQNKLCNTF